MPTLPKATGGPLRGHNAALVVFDHLCVGHSIARAGKVVQFKLALGRQYLT